MEGRTLFWLVFSIALWGIAHSFLASFVFKNFLRRLFGDGVLKFYRLLYNVFSLVSIAPILYSVLILPDQPLYEVPAPWRYLMLAGQALSAVLVLVTLFSTDLLAFLGLRQLIQEEKPGPLVTRGPYRAVRHPLYLFGLLFLWLSPTMSLNLLIVYASLTVYILIAIIFEERKLLQVFGQQYAAYRATTPMLFPGLKIRRNK
jgi:protein-S-isoprenylcysteine O-methyltransferase Ste14